MPLRPDEITPESVYLSRRRFMRGIGAVALAPVLAACAPRRPRDETAAAPGPTDDLGDPATPYRDVTTYNNYYEFSTHKSRPSEIAGALPLAPWTVEVGGLVSNGGPWAVEDLVAAFPPEERVYRLRCVEGWSMVIPWLGFPLARLLERVEPAPEARYVRFESILDPEHMPGQRSQILEWPYVEGLRLDEAMHDLTLLATGLYGKPLPAQNGAPLRLVVPWKYGFKGIKAIVRIDLVAERPSTTWALAAPNEYGFYANVNPEVDHPRWSQASERRIGEVGRRRTHLFNGYADEVAHLYTGMDLRANF